MSGKVVHFEIPFDDQNRAKAFYAEAFGWEVADVPGMAYTREVDRRVWTARLRGTSIAWHVDVGGRTRTAMG